MSNNLWLGLFSLAKLTWLPSYLLSQRHSSLQRMKKEIVSCNQISCLLNKSGRDGLWENKAADINISLFYLDLFHSSVVIWWSLSCQPIIFSYWPNGGVLGERWHPLTFLQLFPWLSPPDTHTHTFSSKAKAMKGFSGGRDPNRSKSTRAKTWHRRKMRHK